MNTTISTRTVWPEAQVFCFGGSDTSSCTILKLINQEKLWMPRIYPGEGSWDFASMSWAKHSPLGPLALFLCAVPQSERCQRGHPNPGLSLILRFPM